MVAGKEAPATKTKQGPLLPAPPQNTPPSHTQTHTPPHNRQRETDARTSILSQILLPPAADRLGRIRLVNAARATDVENRLISLARSGQLRQKITEEQLREILEGISEKTAERERIVVRRTKGWGREEDDLDDLLDL